MGTMLEGGRMRCDSDGECRYQGSLTRKVLGPVPRPAGNKYRRESGLVPVLRNVKIDIAASLIKIRAYINIYM